MAILGVAAVVGLLTAGTESQTARLALVLIAGTAAVVLGAAVLGADTVTRRERFAG